MYKYIKLLLKRVPYVSYVVRNIKRLYHAAMYFKLPVKKLLIWSFRSNETTNYSYNLEPGNREYLASIIGLITKCSKVKIISYFEEIENNNQLKEHIYQCTKESDLSFCADKDAKFGRRIGWYAFVRTKECVSK